MRKFGLIGKALDHSRSKDYFLQKFSKEGFSDCIYENIQMDDLGNFRNLVQSDPDLCGLNITIPYKREVMQYIDEFDPVAEAVEAVNWIKITRKGDNIILAGYNTDAAAFKETLKPLLRNEYHKALVLSTGGASMAVCHALKELNIEYTLVSRKEKKGALTYSGIRSGIIANHNVIINTTPVGMHPDEGKCLPLPFETLTTNHLMYDLIYNPEETLFLKNGREAGARIKNGLEMLYLQAELSWRIWNDDQSLVLSR
jgi:shikimate dehydrogenase